MPSSGSAPTSTPSITAASATLRVIGPAVSWLAAIGMMPLRDTSPSVGFRPTSPPFADGQTIEPLVSVPIDTAVRLAAVATADPEDEPQGERSST